MNEEKGDVITAGIKVFKTGTTKTTPIHYHPRRPRGR